MMQLPFRGVIRSAGSKSFIVTIDKAYINNGLLKSGQEYQFFVELE